MYEIFASEIMINSSLVTCVVINDHCFVIYRARIRYDLLLQVTLRCNNELNNLEYIWVYLLTINICFRFIDFAKALDFKISLDILLTTTL